MVRELSVDGVRRFLDAMSWRGDADALLTLLAAAPLLSPATRLVLGFTPGLAADCGLEFIHPHGAAGDAERGALLEWLVDAGLAERERVDALAEWPGAITPIDARADWPDAMIARELAGAAGRVHFSGFLNHVKLNIAGGRPQVAKAYLSLATAEQRVAAHA
jgi:hypothetical protein